MTVTHLASDVGPGLGRGQEPHQISNLLLCAVPPCMYIQAVQAVHCSSAHGPERRAHAVHSIHVDRAVSHNGGRHAGRQTHKTGARCTATVRQVCFHVTAVTALGSYNCDTPLTQRYARQDLRLILGVDGGCHVRRDEACVQYSRQYGVPARTYVHRTKDITSCSFQRKLQRLAQHQLASHPDGQVPG